MSGPEIAINTIVGIPCTRRKCNGGIGRLSCMLDANSLKNDVVAHTKSATIRANDLIAYGAVNNTDQMEKFNHGLMTWAVEIKQRARNCLLCKIFTGQYSRFILERSTTSAPFLGIVSQPFGHFEVLTSAHPVRLRRFPDFPTLIVGMCDIMVAEVAFSVPRPVTPRVRLYYNAKIPLNEGGSRAVQFPVHVIGAKTTPKNYFQIEVKRGLGSSASRKDGQKM
ncbi:hypothetical protein BU17DRAFT_68593 [Hysterangium stoloniferum]|nr:hypothetical protein BU17DRAFT_68593 [Hysterangium stoloniferum]